MNSIPDKCKGCPELANRFEKYRVLDDNVEEFKTLLGTQNDPAREVLDKSLEVTEQLTEIPRLLKKETEQLLIEAAHNRPWAIGLSFGSYLDQAYNTREPDQFATLLKYSPWHEAFPYAFDQAMEAFHNGLTNLETEIAKNPDAQADFSDISVTLYDAMSEIRESRDSLGQEIENIKDLCSNGVVEHKRGLLRRPVRECGSLAIQNTTS